MVGTVTRVKYLDHYVGAVSFNPETGVSSFQYDPQFIKTGIELSRSAVGRDPRTRRAFRQLCLIYGEAAFGGKQAHRTEGRRRGRGGLARGNVRVTRRPR